MRYYHGLHQYEFVKSFTQTGKQPLSISTPVTHYLPYNDENKL